MLNTRPPADSHMNHYSYAYVNSMELIVVVAHPSKMSSFLFFVRYMSCSEKWKEIAKSVAPWITNIYVGPSASTG